MNYKEIITTANQEEAKKFKSFTKETLNDFTLSDENAWKLICEKINYPYSNAFKETYGSFTMTSHFRFVLNEITLISAFGKSITSVKHSKI